MSQAKTRLKSGSVAIKNLKDIKPQNGKIVIVGSNQGWGSDLDNAYKAYIRCGRPEQFHVYDCHKDVYVTYDGGLRVDSSIPGVTEDKYFKTVASRILEKV